MVLETQPAIKALVGVVLVAIARMMDMNEAQRAAAQYGIGDGKPEILSNVVYRGARRIPVNINS